MERGGALAAIWMRDDRAPIKEESMKKIGGVQFVASSTAQPPRRSRVALRADGAPVQDKGRTKSGVAQDPPPRPCPPIEEKRRTKSGGTRVATSSTAPPPRQSKVALSGSEAPIKEKARSKSGSTQAATSSTAPPLLWSKVAMSRIGAPIEEKTMSKSGSTQKAPPLLCSRVAPNKEKRMTKSSTQEVASSTAPPLHQTKVAICGSGAPTQEKRRMKSGSRQAATSSTAPPLHQSRVPMSLSGAPMEKAKWRTKSSMAKPPRLRKVALSANGFSVDGVQRADIIEDYKHRGGSIYRQTDSLSRLYRLHDINETGLEPMMRSEVTDYCSPNWKACETHKPRTMMQIFSLKLAYPPCDGDPVQVYGFMAVRDTLDHLRNYIFNRTRDDPFTVDQKNGFIQMSGPKRGIWWCDMQLVEFDMRIKRGENEADDLQLIDGAFFVHSRISRHARIIRERIDGDYGSVDIRYALLQLAMEATVQIAVSKLDRGFSLRASMYYISDLLQLDEEMQLFDGAIPADAAGGRYELDKYVVAASQRTKLALKLTIRGGSLDDDVVWRFYVSPASTHGYDDFSFNLDFATIDVRISWSTLDFITSTFGRPLPFMRGYE